MLFLVENVLLTELSLLKCGNYLKQATKSSAATLS